MELSNYFRKLSDKGKLYVVTNKKLLELLNDVYSEIKLTIGAKKFFREEGINKSVFNEILKGQIMPSIQLLENIEKRLNIDIIDSVYFNAEYLRGKTNSNLIKFPKKISEEFVFLLGALRDGSLIHYENVYEIEFAQKQKKWLQNSIVPRLQKVFGSKLKIMLRKNKNYVVRKRSVALYSILNYFTNFAKTKYKYTPEIVLNLPFSLQKYYIAGFYDADGNKDPKEIIFYQQWWNRKNCLPLDDIQIMLNKIDVKSNFEIKSRNNDYLFKLHITDRKGFLEEIPIEHPVFLERFGNSRL